MAKEPQRSKNPEGESEKKPPIVTRPSKPMEAEAFQKWMSFAVSADFLTPERLELLKEMSDKLVREPAMLKMIEKMLTEYGDEIYQLSPSNAELREKGGFGWNGDPGTALVPAAAAAAALAPPAAAMAAAHAPGE